ncbi:MAG: O-antigen ligase family protein [Betaproteobacteria bacterium]
MSIVQPRPTAPPIAGYALFAIAVIAAAGVVLAEPYVVDLISRRIWRKVHLLDFPAKASLLASIALVAASVAVYYARRATDARTLMVVLMAIAMQTSGVKFYPTPLNLITVLPFVVILFVLAESVMRPSAPIHLTSVTFFALLLLLLDLPYAIDLNVYAPTRFIINFTSGLKAIAVAIAIILVIDDERHLRAALRALVIVGIIAAIIGILQILLDKFAHITFSLVTEKAQTKPTFLGTVLRASGLTTWSQHLADYMLLVLPFMLFSVMTARRAWHRLGWLAAIAAVLAAVVLTFSYAGYFGVAVILVIFAFLWWPQRTPHFVLAVVVVCAVGYVFDGHKWLYAKYEKYVASSTGMVERRVYLHATLDELTRDPWAGSGFYAEEEFSGNYYRKRVHNTPLQAWSNLGLAGLAVFLGMMALVYTQLWIAGACAREERWRHRLQALALGMTGAGVAMLAEPNLTAPHTWYMVGLASAAVRVWTAREAAGTPP